MSDIQRYRTNHISGDYYVDPDGELVTYADHVEAVRQAEQRVEARWVEIARIDRENARADESKIMTRMALEAIDDAHERGIKRGQQDERKRSFLLIADAYKQGREQGQRDALAAKHHDPGERCDGCWSFATEEAIAAAVQRVEALPRFYDGAAYPDEVIAAIKGDNDGSV